MYMNVAMMGETFKYCASVAGALGFTAEDTAEAIGLMANAGIKSSQAGTVMRLKWLKVLTEFKQREKISVGYFDTETLEMKETEMFVEGYKAVLVKDTSFKGLWKVSFTLREF